MKITKYLFLISTVIYLAASCNKEDMNPHGLPAATESGENTFGCLINGEPWIAEIRPGVLTPTLHKLVTYYDETETGVFHNNIWTLRAKYVTVDSTRDGFFLSARHFTEPTELKKTANSLEATFSSSYDRPYKYYELDTLLPYQIKITKLDEAANICSGTFEFYGISTNKSDTLHFTEGRFDVKYSPE